MICTANQLQLQLASLRNNNTPVYQENIPENIFIYFSTVIEMLSEENS